MYSQIFAILMTRPSEGTFSIVPADISMEPRLIYMKSLFNCTDKSLLHVTIEDLISAALLNHMRF